MKTCIIIPAKAESKRLPGKNWHLQLPGGGSLMNRCTLTACAAEVDEVLVCGDWSLGNVVDEYISPLQADVAVFRRLPEVSGPDVPLATLMQSCIPQIEAWGQSYDLYILLQCTNPFVTPAHLRACMAHTQYGAIGVDARDRHCGAFYSATREMWLEQGDGWYGNACWLRVEPSVDIDTQADWDEACRLLEGRHATA